MTHIHSVEAQSIAAAQYQLYLDRIQANLLARRKGEPVKAPPPRTFDSLIEAETEADGEDAPPGEQGRDPSSADKNDGTEGDAEGGFGTHYA